MPRPAPTERHFSYPDYCRWPDDERWELIDGRPFNMYPAPTRQHQRLMLEIGRQLGNQLGNGPCEVYLSPFDVRLAEGDEPDDEIVNVVQPDVAVICDQVKPDDAGCRGAPDFDPPKPDRLLAWRE